MICSDPGGTECSIIPAATTLRDRNIPLPDGRIVSYVRRRFLPPALPLLAEITVAPGERIDLIANRTLGDPLAFWRLCDANDVIDPTEATADPTRACACRCRKPDPRDAHVARRQPLAADRADMPLPATPDIAEAVQSVTVTHNDGGRRASRSCCRSAAPARPTCWTTGCCSIRCCGRSTG